MIKDLWEHYELGNIHVLKVNGVEVATIQEADEQAEDEKAFEVYDYDSDFSMIFSNGQNPRFPSVDEAKIYCNTRFLKWLQETNELLKDTK